MNKFSILAYKVLSANLFFMVASKQYYFGLKMNKIFRFVSISLLLKLSFLILNHYDPGPSYDPRTSTENERERCKRIVKSWYPSALGTFSYFIPLWITTDPYVGTLKRMKRVPLLESSLEYIPYVYPLNILKDDPALRLASSTSIISHAPSTVLKASTKNLNFFWNIFEPETKGAVFKFLYYTVFVPLYNERRNLVVLVLYYFIIYRNRRNKKVDYFIKFHLMHSILLIIMLMPIGYSVVILRNTQIGGKSMKIFWDQFAFTAVIVNYSVIFYCMLCAATNNYFKFPVITEGAKLHLGEDTGTRI
jgi:hypothetical protein